MKSFLNRSLGVLLILATCFVAIACSSDSDATKPTSPSESAKAQYEKAMVFYAEKGAVYDEDKQFAPAIGKCLADETYSIIAPSSAEYLISIMNEESQKDSPEKREQARLDLQSDEEEKAYDKDFDTLYGSYIQCKAKEADKQ